MTTVIESVGSLNYDRPKLANTDNITLPIEMRQMSGDAANEVKTEVWVSLDPANVAQQDTIAITAGVAGDLYSVAITVGANTETYIYKMKTGDDAVAIAIGLSKLLNVDLNIQATVAAGATEIKLKGTVPGTAYTIDVSDSTTAGNLAVTSDAVASGTALHRKIYDITLKIDLTVSDTGSFPKGKISTKSYDGATTPVLLQSFDLETPTHSKSLDALQTTAGVART